MRAWFLHRWLLLLACLLGAVAGVSAGLAAAYSIRLQRSARAILDSAVQIRTTADAAREVAWWRKRFGNNYQEYQNGDYHCYQVILYPSPLLTLMRMVHATDLNVMAATQDGTLHHIIVSMSSGRPGEVSSVWVGESFASHKRNGLVVDGTEIPGYALVTTGVSLTADQTDDTTRMEAFALDTHCFLPWHRCGRPEDILPTLTMLAIEADGRRPNSRSSEPPGGTPEQESALRKRSPEAR